MLRGAEGILGESSIVESGEEGRPFAGEPAFSTVQGLDRACGGTAKSPRRDGMAQGSPLSSVNSQDGRHYEG